MSSSSTVSCKPKVLVVHNRYLRRGGEDECREAECTMLRSRGHEVVEYLRDNNETANLFSPKVALGAIWSSGDYREVRRIIRREEVQIVHLHNYFPLISPSVYSAAHDEGVPIVHTLHNYRQVCPSGQLIRGGKVCEDCVGKTFPWPGILHGCYRESRSATAAVAVVLTTHRFLKTWTDKVDAYIVVSDFMRRKLISGGLPPAKIFLKPNFSVDRGPGEGRGAYFLFVGRLSEEKGLSTLLSAWQHLGARVPLKIIGDGPLKSFIAERASGASAIQFLGTVPQTDVLRLMGNALALIVPSVWYEGAPRVIVESMSTGTPVIASDLGGMMEMVEHEVSGLRFRAGNSAELAQTIRRLLQDPDLTARLRKGARNRFLMHFTEEQNYKLLISIYAQVASSATQVSTLRTPISVS